MTKFEQYLIDTGFVTNFDTNKFKQYSSLGTICNKFVKDDMIIEYGLGQNGYTPYILYPNFDTKIVRKFSDGISTFEDNSLAISRQLVESTFDPKYIVEHIFDENFCFNIDLSESESFINYTTFEYFESMFDKK